MSGSDPAAGSSRQGSRRLLRPRIGVLLLLVSLCTLGIWMWQTREVRACILALLGRDDDAIVAIRQAPASARRDACLEWMGRRWQSRGQPLRAWVMGLEMQASPHRNALLEELAGTEVETPRGPPPLVLGPGGAEPPAWEDTVPLWVLELGWGSRVAGGLPDCVRLGPRWREVRRLLADLERWPWLACARADPALASRARALLDGASPLPRGAAAWTFHLDHLAHEAAREQLTTVMAAHPVLQASPEEAHQPDLQERLERQVVGHVARQVSRALRSLARGEAGWEAGLEPLRLGHLPVSVPGEPGRRVCLFCQSPGRQPPSAVTALGDGALRWRDRDGEEVHVPPLPGVPPN